MLNSSTISSNPTDKESLLQEFLSGQQELTAVEEFSQQHSEGVLPKQSRYYSHLLPSSTPGAGEQYSFEVDLDKCSGCKACVTGCHSRNGLDEEETWRDVGMITLPESSPTVPTENEYTKAFQHVTTACHHCAEPACLQGCPVLAYEKDPETGVVKHLDDQCFGCQYCTLKCPYGVPKYSKERGIVRKCDLCIDRLKEGEAPACVQSCPNEAIQIKVVSTYVEPKELEERFLIPGAPDPTYTQPTTTYISSKPLEVLKEMENADHDVVSIQHGEWPLVGMTVLTQLSVGLSLCLALSFSFLPGLTENLSNSLFSISALLSGVFVVGGLLVAPLHLGRPHLMFRAFLGWRTSWLSREVIAFTIYAKVLIATIAITTSAHWFSYVSHHIETYFPGFSALTNHLNNFPIPNPILFPSLWGITAFIGIGATLCSAMIYKDTPRAWWASPTTLGKFVFTGIWVGSSFYLLLTHLLPGSFQSSLLYIALFSGIIGGIYKGFLEWSSLKIPKDDFKAHNVKKVRKVLMGPLKKPWSIRIISGVLGIVFSLASLLLLITSENSSFLIGLSGLSFLFILLGEITERYLFFAASVPPQMPGIQNREEV